jgi:hypothetical protein
MTDGATREWVATTGSARSSAVAMCRYGFSRRPFWAVFGALWVVATVLLTSSVDDDYSAPARWLAGAVYAAMGTAIVLTVVVLASALVNWRLARQRLRPGSVWHATATADSLTMSGPLLVRVSIPFHALEMVRVVGDWVLMKQRGVPIVNVWPRELFSDESLARMMSAA